MNSIYIFRGSPASGKGTITAEFLKQLPGKVVFLELDKFRWGFHLVNREVGDVSEVEHQLAYKNYLSVLENYLKSGQYTIVTEGLFSWDKPSPHGNMQDVLLLAKKYDFKSFPILLFADLETLWMRNLAREYSVPEGEFSELYSHVMDKQDKSEIVVDVTKNTVMESIKELTKLL
jgi:predicted kinase